MNKIGKKKKKRVAGSFYPFIIYVEKLLYQTVHKKRFSPLVNLLHR